MNHFYHIRCNTDLDEGFCDIRCIPCAYTGCVEKLYNPWLLNLDKTLHPCYSIKTETCRYSSILRGYNKWYTAKLTLKKKQKTKTI